MSDAAAQAGNARASSYLWLLGLILLTGALYFVAAGSWGLWEPWETQYAGLGRELATGDASLFAEDERGDLVGKPWLVTLLMEVGYRLSRGGLLARLPLAAVALLLAWPIAGLLAPRTGKNAARAVGIGVGAAVAVLLAAIGSEEMWLRAPYAALAVATVAIGFGWLARYVSPLRAGISALILATSPIFLLSAVNLAGAMPQIAFSTAALAAFFTALDAQRSRLWLLVAGLATGLTLWAGGMPGMLLVLFTIAAYGGWALARHRDVPATSNLLSRMEFWAVLAAIVLLAYPVIKWAQVGFTDARDVIGFYGPLGLALAVIVAATGSVPMRALRGPGLAIFVAAMAVIGAVPLILLSAERTAADALHFLLYNDFLTRRTLADHVSFDTLIRQVGFAAYPYTMFLPLALAWLVQSIPRFGANAAVIEPPAVDSDDAEDVRRNGLKIFAACWLVVGFVLVGLTATLTRHYIFTAVMPAAMAIGLMLTDGRYWRALRTNRTVLYVIGIGCLVVLMVLTKDLKTVANPEMGQLGPEVLFEFLLVDGRVQFPKSYVLPFVPIFRLIWIGAIFVFFWALPSWLSDPSPAAGPPSRTGAVRRALGTVGRGLRAAVLFPFHARPLRTVGRLIEAPALFAVLLVGSAVVFAGVTAAAYLPSLSDHLSNRGLIDTYRHLADEGETFYRVGTSSNQVSYYLGEDSIDIESGAVNPIESLRSIGELRRFFCQPDSRIWAMVERDSLAQAYYEVRHREANVEDCDPARNLWVLDARSSRFVLVSNQLGEGEENQNPLAQHVFAELPEDATEVRGEGGAPYTFDGQLRLLGYRVLDEDDNPISEASSGDKIWLETFFEVVERASSPREMFIHLDYRSSRINGDHQPVSGEFPINYWVPGEIVRDRFQLLVEPGSATGEYTFFIGFFTGDSRMQVRPATGDNRVRLGTIQIQGGI